jgi:rhodanese-related sulfurtransferase
MKLSISGWSLKSKLALAAFVLGALAVFGDPTGGGAVTIHPQELAALVQKEVDHVSVHDLAGWIVQGKSDYRLIDLRDAGAYSAYHIPPAENLAITDLPGDTLARNEKIVLYSEGGIHSAQAWFLLKAQGFEGVYILRGGHPRAAGRLRERPAVERLLRRNPADRRSAAGNSHSPAGLPGDRGSEGAGSFHAEGPGGGAQEEKERGVLRQRTLSSPSPLGGSAPLPAGGGFR